MCEHITGACTRIIHVYNEQSPTNMREYNTGVYMYFSCLQWANSTICVSITQVFAYVFFMFTMHKNIVIPYED